jgi:hypothetical protein
MAHVSHEAPVQRDGQHASDDLPTHENGEPGQDWRFRAPAAARARKDEDSGVRAFRSFDRAAIVADQRTLQWPRVRKVARLQVSLVRKPLVDVGRSVELPDESLIRIVLLTASGEPAERPDRDCERESQEQQSGREP